MPLSSHNSSPLYYLSKKQLFRYGKWRMKANPIYLKSCQFFGATLIDRTGMLDSGLDFSIIDPIPQPSAIILSFEECCEQRATAIVQAITGSIKVLWSGGIDSTVALISLIKALQQQNELSRLKVLLSQESVEEYPRFYHEVIEGKLAVEKIKTTIFEGIAPQELIVTGEHGDQLFGSDKLKYTILTGEAFRPYEEILSFIISRKLGTTAYTSKIIDFLSLQIQQSPIKINTLYDYMWWMNFSLKWQTVSMRLVHGLGREAIDLEKNVFHFFNSKAFQQWSMANHHAKIKQEWNSYKYVAKELIYRFHPDEFYLLYKEKEASLKEVIVGEAPPSLVKKLVRGMMGT